VLVVDDVLMNRDIAGSYLRAGGHTATCVEGGAEAVAAAATTDFDIILMDVRMPGMDGLEATRRIRALDGARGRVPIVALTAQAFTEQIAECRKAGMDIHLAKPFDLDVLLEIVAHACEARVTEGEGGSPSVAPTILPEASAVPVPGAELPVFNSIVFNRAANHLAPDAVATYLQTIAEQGKILLHGLRQKDASTRGEDELAERAHTLAGCAGMFGFERLAMLGRHFERAIQSGAPNAPNLADALSTAIEAVLRVIHSHIAQPAAA
jgi:CheY-like chemotaxis protein/HPt (histidine-containing phosphotransfer) domain-containing protein